jgi:CHASE2 domain-containing sensor protein
MVRDRVGDWRLAWRFALAGVIAGILVIALTETGVTGATFDAGQDQLFPGPTPDSRITLVEVDSRTQRGLGYPFNNGVHAQVINYLSSLRPKVILFDIVLRLTGNNTEPPWVPMPTEVAKTAYTTQSVFA